MVRLDAPVAHLAPRQFWNSVTSAFGNVFGNDDDEIETMTTFIVKTVTAPTRTAARETLVTAEPARDRTTIVRTTATQVVNTNRPPPVRTGNNPTTTLPAFIPPTDTAVSDTTLALAETTALGAAETEIVITKASTTAGTKASASATASAQTEGSGDSSSAAKAGIIIGVLAGVLGVFLVVWFLFNRRRKQMAKKQQEVDDEKLNGPINPFADTESIRTPTNAPQLSLRPVTQFLPGGLPDRRTSRGAGAMLNPGSAANAGPLHRPAGASAWERPTTSSTMNAGNPWDRPETSMSTNSANPFNDTQRIAEESAQNRSVSPVSMKDGNTGIATTTSPPEPVSPIDGVAHEFPAVPGAAGAVAGAVVGGAAVGLARKASIRKDVPRPLDLTMPLMPPMNAVPPSPAGTEYSMQSVAPGQAPGPSTSAAAIAAAGGPAQSAVHRVQLDFKPTMEDELGLQAGQLVRLLHEYDDGWALCIRLDRSKQGVVPRTCLSTRPVKPRNAQGGPPRGPPVNPNRGPGYPPHPGMGQRGPPMGPPYPRSQSPAGPRMGPGPQGRPSSPYGRPGSAAGGGRSMSPGPRYQPQPRPESPSGRMRQGSPPGPGQAY